MRQLRVSYLVTRILRWGRSSWRSSTGSSRWGSAQPHAWALFTGLALQLFAGDAVTIRLNLYVFDNVSRARLTQFEPMRMFLAGIGWITGPLAGAYISTRLASWAPFLLSTGFFLAMYVYFRVPRARSNPTAS